MGLFEELAGKTLEGCASTFNERGQQYGDTFAENKLLAVKAVKEVREQDPVNSGANHWDQAESLATLIDIKYHRLLGGYKKDTLVDLINYAAALVELIERYDKRPTVSGTTE